jgi:MFS family permease
MSRRVARSVIDVDNTGFVLLVSLTHGINEFFSIVVPPLFPFLVPGLDIGYSEASLLVVVFFLTYSVVQLPVGPLADVYDERALLVGGTVVLACGIALVALAPTFPLMLAGMFVAGVGGSTYHPTGMALISDVETNATHGRSMGVHGTMGSAGTVVAPALVVAVAEILGWRAALVVAAFVGVGFALSLYVLYPRVAPATLDDTPTKRAATDGAGNERRTGDSLTAGSSPPSFVEAVRSTLLTEVNLRETSTQVARYLRAPATLALIGLFLVVGAEVRAIQTFTAAFATASVGAGPSYGGAMLSVTMISAGIASMLAGYGVDLFSRTRFALACFLGTAVLVVALVRLPLSALTLPIGFVVLGFVLYAVYPAANAIAASAAGGRSGSLFAVTNTAAAIGGAAGPHLLGVVADAASLEVAFLAAAGIALCGVPVALYSGRVLTGADR